MDDPYYVLELNWLWIKFIYDQSCSSILLLDEWSIFIVGVLWSELICGTKLQKHHSKTKHLSEWEAPMDSRSSSRSTLMYDCISPSEYRRHSRALIGRLCNIHALDFMVLRFINMSRQFSQDQP
jgi:hypothetical protein